MGGDRKEILSAVPVDSFNRLKVTGKAREVEVKLSVYSVGPMITMIKSFW